jgi:hypothetical protein
MAPPDLRSVIGHLVEQWLAAPTHLELVEAVRNSGAVPVYVDIGGALVLRADGEILCYPWDSLAEPAPESDASWRLTAVVVGAEKHPELRPLLPVRPIGTADCQWCAGRGRICIGESDRKRGPICGSCYGIGWLGAASFFVTNLARGEFAHQGAGPLDELLPGRPVRVTPLRTTQDRRAKTSRDTRTKHRHGAN